MKSKLPASAASPRQDPPFVSDLKFDGTNPSVAPTTRDQLGQELPQLEETGEPIPVGAPSEPATDNLSSVPDGADDPEIAPTTFNDGEIGAAITEPEPDSRTAAPVDTSGKVIREDGLERTSALDEPVQAKSNDSFLIDQWPYLLIGVTLVGWVLSQFLFKRDPSLRSPVKRPTNETLENPRGQFKKAERFMKPKDKETPEEEPLESPPPLAAKVVEKTTPADPEPAALKEPEEKTTKQQRVNTMPIAQPADDDFDFELSDSGSDSDVFSLDDAAEINEAVEVPKSGGSSKRFKTEDDVDASVVSDDLEIDEDEFVSFDDQDSQLSLADSDTEFGFDVEDEEPNSFLDSGKEVAETLTENVEAAGESLGDLGLADVADSAKDAVSGVADGAQAGIAAAGAAAAGVAAGAAAKGGFFARLFGAKEKKNNAEPVEDNPLDDSAVGSFGLADDATEAFGQVEQLADVPDELDVPGLVDDSLELDDVADVESLDGGDSDFDFDLDDDDSGSAVPAAVVAEEDAEFDLGAGASDLDNSGELMLDLDDSDEEVAVEELDALADDAVAEAEPVQTEELAIDADLDDSGELSFDLDDLDEEVAVGELDALADDVVAEAEPVQTEELAIDADLDDSGELSFDLDDSDEEVSISSMETLVDEPIAKAVPAEDIVVDSDDDDSGEFGFGLFEDEGEPSDTESAEVANVTSDDDVDSSVTAPVVAAATAAVGAGLAGIGLAGSSSADTTESDHQWELKLNALEDQNTKLTSQVTTLTKQLEDAKESGAKSDSLQQEHDALTETVKTLGSEKEDLLKEKEQFDTEKKRLAEELEAAQKKSEEWEQEKAELLKQQEELKAEKEAADSELETLATKKEDSASELSALQDEVTALTQQRSEFESEVKALQTKLADAQAKPAESGASEDIDDLRERFKRRLASEHRKRKQAEQLVEEAESQRNEVAKLLRAAKTELKELKS